MLRCTASQGTRRSAPISGGPNGASPGGDFVKRLDECGFGMYGKVTLPHGRVDTMPTSAREEIRIGPLAIRFLLEGEESGGSVAVFEFDVPAGAVVAAGHSHDGFEETLYGLEGVLTWTVDGTPIDVGPGDVLCIPRGAVHQFANTGDVAAKSLAVVTPGILGPDYFREVAAILGAAAGGPPDYEALGEVMRRHGLTCAE